MHFSYRWIGLPIDLWRPVRCPSGGGMPMRWRRGSFLYCIVYCMPWTKQNGSERIENCTVLEERTLLAMPQQKQRKRLGDVLRHDSLL